MRFLHTADWQIGMKAVHLGGAGPRVRSERLKSARRVINLANEHKVDFVILAGDTFEDNGVGRDLIREVITILSQSRSPVYILPGNHDPFCPGSIWLLPQWKENSTIRVLSEQTTVAIENGVLFPCPARERRSALNPAAWIDPDATGAFRIAVAHGSVEGLQLDEPDYPIPRSLPDQKKLDYVALGHWHSTGTIPQDGPSRMAYSGTHEPTRFGERESGNVLLVTITEPGSLPSIETVSTAGLTWIDETRKVSSPGDLQSVLDFAEKIADPDNVLLRLKLHGLYPLQDLEWLDRVRALGNAGRFLHCEIDAAALRPTPPDSAWLESITDPLIREAARRIACAEAITENDAVREQALLELYQLSQEAIV